MTCTCARDCSWDWLVTRDNGNEFSGEVKWVQVRMEFKYDGGGLAKGGNVSLHVDGKKDGEGRIAMTAPMVFSCDETCDVGKGGRLAGVS